MNARSLLVWIILLAAPIRALASPAPNAVTDWALIVQQSIHNASAPRSAGTSQILHTMVMLAIYDAVVAIEGKYEPFAKDIYAAPWADVRAAVATAAHHTARARIATSQLPALDQQYANYLATIADGPGKNEGIRVGAAAAAAILERRADDGFDAVVSYECSAIPPAIGEFEPDAGCPAGPASPQPVDAKLGQIEPFTFAEPGRFRMQGPLPLASKPYADDFDETRRYGRIDSAVRTPEQTDIAYFWSENPYVHWNRNLTALAISYRLNTLQTARFFAMVHTSVSDAIIAGFAAKYHFRAWRPRTAIPLAEFDGNKRTDADPTWRPLLSVNHPEYPSGHGFWSTALLEGVAAFFNTKHVTWTLVTSKAAVPQLVRDQRTYHDLDQLQREIGNARIWAGLHWRHAIEQGEKIGARVAEHVTKKYFKPAR
jgi:hypothetical protein